MKSKKTVSFDSKLQKYKLLSVFLSQQIIFALTLPFPERPAEEDSYLQDLP